MRPLAFIAGFIAATIATTVSAENLGKELKLASRNGKPHLSVHYSIAKSKIEVFYVSRISEEEVRDLPEMLDAFFVELDSKARISRVFGAIREALKRGYFVSFEIDDGAAALKYFDNLGIAFATREGGKWQPLYWIRIGALCERHPELFWNSDEARQGCR